VKFKESAPFLVKLTDYELHISGSNRDKVVFLLPIRLSVHMVHLTTCSMDTGGSFLEGKATEAGSYPFAFFRYHGLE
jgi:hypothetical protein